MVYKSKKVQFTNEKRMIYKRIIKENSYPIKNIKLQKNIKIQKKNKNPTHQHNQRLWVGNQESCCFTITYSWYIIVPTDCAIYKNGRNFKTNGI